MMTWCLTVRWPGISSGTFRPSTPVRSSSSWRIKQQAELMETGLVLQRSIRLRNPYVDPLNYLQVEMLRRLRALADPEGEEATACAR